MFDDRAGWDQAVLARLREETPGCGRVVHLNNAGAALMPSCVLDAVKSHLDLEMAIGGYEAADAMGEAVDGVYASLARLLGCRPENIALTENSTASYLQALSAIPFESGDRILTSRDDYVSNQIMFLSLAKRLGIEVVRAPDLPQGGIDVDAVEKLIAVKRPRLVALSHVPTNSGLVQPVREVGGLCRRTETLYLVDACQSAGQLPLDVSQIGCDFLSGTSRKYLRGPRGAGFLFVSDRALQAGMEPLFLDMRGADWVGASEYRVRGDAKRYENWEFAYSLVLGLGAAACYAMDVGIERIAARVRALAQRTREVLGRIPNVRVLDRGEDLCGIVSLEIDGLAPEALHADLKKQGINTALSYRRYAVINFAAQNSDWALRVSPHYYNTDEEIDALSSALAQAAARPVSSL